MADTAGDATNYCLILYKMTVTRRLRTLHVCDQRCRYIRRLRTVPLHVCVGQRCRYTLYGGDYDATTPYPARVDQRCRCSRRLRSTLARVDQRCRCIRRLRTLYPCTCEPAVPLYYVHGVDMPNKTKPHSPYSQETAH